MPSTTKPILIHTFAGVYGGSERILLDLLRRSERHVVLACPDGPLADAAAGDGIAVILAGERQLEARGGAAPAKAAIATAAHALEISSLVRDIDPRIVVSWGMRAAMASTVARAMGGMRSATGSKPPIVAEHVDLLPVGRQGHIARRALLRCDRTICLSAAIAADLDPDWTTNPRIAVVHPGVAATPASATATDAPNAHPTALLLAAIEPWKGQDTALEAAAMVPDLKLIVAGSPLSDRGTVFEAELRARAARPDLAGRVEFVGIVDSHEELTKATVLLHPAPAEPFGMSMAEALSSGTPVVASAAAGALEIIDDSCGRLVAPGDAAGFASALTEICGSTETLKQLGAAGRKRAAELFDPEVQARLWQSELSRADLGSTATKSANDRGAGLALVTVIHNSAPDLSRLLSSVSRHLPEAQVVVVDSGSSDAGPAIASLWDGKATILTLESNQGFGAGCVAGIDMVDRPVTALINPDVELIDDSLATLSAALTEPGSPDRLLTPLLLHRDGRRQDAVHPVPGAPAEVVRALMPAAAMPGPLAEFAEPHRLSKPRRVGWAVAACLLGRTETLKALGPFDTSVHLYAEDLDLCLRAADRGIETWYRPDARVIHREAHSSQQVFGGEPSQLLADRRRAVISARLGSKTLQRDDRIQLATHLNRKILKTLARRDSSVETARIAALKQARAHSSR